MYNVHVQVHMMYMYVVCYTLYMYYAYYSTCNVREHVHVSNVYVYTPTAGVCDLPINRIDPLCKNEGKCINTGVLEYRCECLPGYEGRYCEIRVNYGQLMYMYIHIG